MPYYLLFAIVIFIISCIAYFILNKIKSLKCFSELIISISGKNDLAVAKIAVFALYALVAILVIDVSVLLSDLIFNSFISVAQNNESKPEASTLVGSLGTFGDFFGGTLNPILTFLTFICLLITISLQRKEIKKSEEDLLKNERESRFFKLLDIYSDAVNDLRLSPADVVLDIRSILDAQPSDALSINLIDFLDSEQNKYKEKIITKSDLIGPDVIEFMLYHTRLSTENQNDKKYKDILEQQKEKFYYLYKITNSSFYRYIFTTGLVLSFIQKEKKSCTESETVFYKSVFKSKISEAEYSIIILHCMHRSDDARFIRMVSDTGILSGLYFKTFESNICLFGKQLLIDLEVAKSLGGFIIQNPIYPAEQSAGGA